MNNVGDYVYLDDLSKCLIFAHRKNVFGKVTQILGYTSEYGIIQLDNRDYKLVDILPNFTERRLESDKDLDRITALSESRVMPVESLYPLWLAVLKAVNTERHETNMLYLKNLINYK